MGPLEIVFIPFLAAGLFVPLTEMARMLAARGQHVTIITTPSNAAKLPTVHDVDAGLPVQLSLVPFPSEAVGLPAGIENFSDAPDVEAAKKLYRGFGLLRPRMEERLMELRPDCIVSDMFYPWTTDVAARLRIPRLCFQGHSAFALCVEDIVIRHSLHESVDSESDPFVVPGLPGPEITMTRAQLPDYLRMQTELTVTAKQWRDAELRSFGVLVNSFYELEPGYPESYQKTMGHRVFPIGPTILSVCRGRDDAMDRECLNWLDSKPPNSVLYVSFGSGHVLPHAQLREIACALDASGHHFILVVKGKNENEGHRWLPEGFEKKWEEEKKGIIVRGWAPQVPILSHPGTGGFVTHCGWNSAVEAVSAGVPMVAWPLTSEQFYNEKLLTRVLRIGVAVGAAEWSSWGDAATGKKEVIGRERIGEAVRAVMGGGGEAAELRRRAAALSAAAKAAVAEGGSSFKRLTALIEDLKLERAADGYVPQKV